MVYSVILYVGKFSVGYSYWYRRQFKQYFTDKLYCFIYKTLGFFCYPVHHREHLALVVLIALVFVCAGMVSSNELPKWCKA